METTSGEDALYSEASVPSMLHACTESRKVALKWYKLSFVKSDETINLNLDGFAQTLDDDLFGEQTTATARIYFDWERDGLYSQCANCNGIGTTCGHFPLSFDQRRIKRLVYEGPLSMDPFYRIGLIFTHVEDIILVRGHSMVPRKAVVSADFFPVQERFQWEGDDLLASCLQTIQNKLPGCPAIDTITSVRRATLLDVDETEFEQQNELGYWPCR